MNTFLLIFLFIFSVFIIDTFLLYKVVLNRNRFSVQKLISVAYIHIDRKSFFNLRLVNRYFILSILKRLNNVNLDSDILYKLLKLMLLFNVFDKNSLNIALSSSDARGLRNFIHDELVKFKTFKIDHAMIILGILDIVPEDNLAEHILIYTDLKSYIDINIEDELRKSLFMFLINESIISLRDSLASRDLNINMYLFLLQISIDIDNIPEYFKNKPKGIETGFMIMLIGTYDILYSQKLKSDLILRNVKEAYNRAIENILNVRVLDNLSKNLLDKFLNDYIDHSSELVYDGQILRLKVKL